MILSCAIYSLLVIPSSISIILVINLELDESVLDGLGILPQRKQHKKLLLVGPKAFFVFVFSKGLYFSIMVDHLPNCLIGSSLC